MTSLQTISQLQKWLIHTTEDHSKLLQYIYNEYLIFNQNGYYLLTKYTQRYLVLNNILKFIILTETKIHNIYIYT